MKKRVFERRSIIAILCCSPLFLILLLYAFGSAAAVFLPPSSKNVVLDFFFTPIFLAYLVMPSSAGIFYLLVCLVVTIRAAISRPKSWASRIVLALAMVAIILGAAYDIWWYATAQHYEYP